ncbi:MAG: MoxR family ATPase [Lachnospiraceae bacterium]|nr:MoxR family ATPase [Lachnospiraceae bacterium]
MIQNENELRMMIEKLNAAEAEIGNAIIGQKQVIRQVLLAMLSGGNVLLEGVPGLGKTQLVKAVASVCSMDFSRIQFTPDLMPADVTGTNLIVKEDGRNVFQFQKGPVFANLVLADEINRATPKTQSALLEAMQEHTVTVGNETYALAEPFMVLATQNPIENEGTYPLPEAQLDRFLFKIQVDFPTLDELKQIMDITVTNKQVSLRPVLTGEDIVAMRSAIRDIPMADAVAEYALKVVVATHPEVSGASDFVKRYVSCGASPRAAQAIYQTARAKAMMENRFNVSFDDIKSVAYPALRHRLVLSFEALADGVTADEIIKQILDNVKVG